DLVVTPASGGTIKWYNASTGGTPYTDPANTLLVNGTTYYASQTVNGVESTARLAVTATANPLPTPSFTAQPGATANINTDVTYTTQSGKSSYVWTFPGTVSIDYTITSGGTSSDNSVTLKYITPGSKTVTINYTANSCTAASAASSAPTIVSMIPPGNAMAFDGSNDFVDVGNGTSVKLTQGTLEAWIKTSGSGTNSNIITKQWAYGLFLYNNVLAIYEWGGAGFISTGINLADNRWHHVAFSFNSGVSNGSFVYVDGELKLTTKYTVSNQNVSLGIGALTSGGELFTGTIDEVRIWNTLRSQAEIQSTLYTEMAGTESGLLLNYNFNQGVAGGNNTGITTLFDKTSNANNGTLRNFSNTGSTSNFVESYAMTVPVPAAATSLTSTGFTANWAAPVTGTVSSYKLDVSTSSTFGSFVTGYNTLDCGTSLSQTVSGLTAGTTYYYRVRADKTSLTGSGGYYRTPVTVTTTNGDAIYNALSTSQASYTSASTYALVKITSTEYDAVKSALSATTVGYTGVFSDWATNSAADNTTFSYNGNTNDQTTSTFGALKYPVAFSFHPAVNPAAAYTCQLKYNNGGTVVNITSLYSGATTATIDRQYFVIKTPAQLPNATPYISLYSSKGIATVYGTGSHYWGWVSGNVTGSQTFESAVGAETQLPSIQVLQTTTKQWP
ncbi:hypothetical protein JZU61_03060, partial [bacterium]|nr:hypothetical protein [bacterium]